MNKSELVREIMDQAGVTKNVAEKVLKAFTSSIMDAVAKGDKVSLVGFGSFFTITRKARQGRNPATGDVIDIPEKTVPKFSPGKAFTDKIQ